MLQAGPTYPQVADSSKHQDSSGLKQNKMRSQATGASSAISKVTNERKRAFIVRSTTTMFLLVTLSSLVICTFVGLIVWSLAKDPHEGPDQDYDEDNDSSDLDDIRDTYPTTVTKSTSSVHTSTLSRDATTDRTSIRSSKGPTGDTSPAGEEITIWSTAVTSEITRFTTPTTTSTTTTSSTSTTTSTSRVRVLNPCATNECNTQSTTLTGQLKFTVDPCENLYEFVCGNYHSGTEENAYTKAQAAIRNATFDAIYNNEVPARSQSAWEKSAGLVKACFRHVTNKYDEVNALKSWLVDMNLDVTNLGAAWRVDPVDMAVRLALGLGIPVLFDFALADVSFIKGKRAMKFRISDIRETWHNKLKEMKKWPGTLHFYREQLSIYPGYDLNSHQNLPTVLHNYDQILISRIERHVNAGTPFSIGALEDMDFGKQPHIRSVQWAASVTRYTYGAYEASDKVTFQKELLQDFANVLADNGWGSHGMRAVLAWGLFEALLPYTRLNELAGGKDAKAFCFDQVLQIMELPITARYMRNVVSQTALNKATDIFVKVYAAFKAALNASRWLRGPARDTALRKMEKLKAHIGSPGQKLDENYMNQYYARFPDIPPNGSFFGGWLKIRSALVHQKWTDQTNVIFSISRLTSYYVYEDNVVIVPAGALLPVFFPADGNAVLNYAKLGNDLAGKIMKAFDRTGILYDENGQVNPWNTTATVQRYIFNMRCLHHSHEKAGYSPLDLPLNETVASENVADLAAATTAHAAYQMLHTSERSNTLPGLNITAEELYFIGRCTDACKYKNYTDTPAGHLSRPSSRCEVPAMNMEAFAQTFGCSAQARMNPSPKCSVW